MEYLYKSVLMGYIAELQETDPSLTLKELLKEIESGRFDAKNIHREQEDLYEAALRAKEAIETWDKLMSKTGLKKND